MHGNNQVFLEDISSFLGSYYLLLAAMNFVAAYWLWRNRQATLQAIFWFVVGLGYVGYLAPMALSGDSHWMPSMPQAIRDGVNAALGGSTGAVVYSVGLVVVFAILFLFRRFFVQGPIAWALLNLALLALGLSMTDSNFYAIAAKPDNVPIVGLVFLLGFFTWLSAARAVENDTRAARGESSLEHQGNEKVLVWPDLVYTELICMVALTAFLLLWGIGLQAPLEEPASSVKTPNPSKAPWYFLGLQEMLVYFDPWLAGVVLPVTIIGGLMAVPYIDFNKTGNGYFCFKKRAFAVCTFMFGFLPLWVAMIVLGTFLRGPNWNFFGIYEYWDVHKVEAANNVNLSQIFWELPVARSLYGGIPKGGDIGTIILRESPGIVLVGAYFAVLPMILGMTILRRFLVQMGVIRFLVFSNLILWMAILPIKMLLRWTFALKYIVGIPEWFFNI